MERYADSVATGDDFFQSIADGSGNPDVVEAMKSFVDQAGLPIVTGRVMHSGGASAIHLTQSRYAPLGSVTQQGQIWQIPVCAKFGYGTETVKNCSLMKEKSAVLKSSRAGTADWVMPNENGAGYYRFALDTDGWTALLANLDKLNSRELLTVQDSLESAFRAGKVDAGVFIKGMEEFAKSPDYDVASAAGDWLGWMHKRLPESSRTDVAQLSKDMYSARYKNIVGKDTTEGNLLAPTLAARLINYGADSALKAEFAKKGRAYINGDKTAVAPNLLSRALQAAMENGDMAMAANLLDMARNGSSFEKGAAIGALVQTKDKDIFGMLLDTALVDKDTITGRQATTLISSLMDSDEYGDQTWDWLKSNFTQFVSSRVPDVRKGRMPGLASDFCSLQRRDEVRDFFEYNAKTIPGYERSLAQALES